MINQEENVELQLAEAWVNGNRKDVKDFLRGLPALEAVGYYVRVYNDLLLHDEKGREAEGFEHFFLHYEGE